MWSNSSTSVSSATAKRAGDRPNALGCALLAGSLLALTGCPRSAGPSTPGARSASDDVAARAGQAVDPARCNDSDARLRPFIVDWDATEQAELEALATQSVVLVKVDGCSLQLLPQCAVPGVYKLVESSSRAQALSLTSRDALYAEVPFSVASLGAHLEGSGSLDLRYFIRGLKVASAPVLYRSQLGAGCEPATHMVINYAVGAYELGGSSSTRADAEAKGFGASAGGGTKRGSKAAFRSGELAKCETDPEVCTAPVRLRLVPIVDAPPTVAPAIAVLATQRPRTATHAPTFLSPEVVEATIRSATPSLRACMERNSAYPDDFALNVEMSIGEDGTVLGVELFRPIPGLGRFFDCARDALRSLRFPPVKYRMSFTRTYNFRW